MLYVFVVAVLNLSLGVGVAVYLGRRYRALPIAGIAWDAGGPGQLAEATENVVASPVPDATSGSPPEAPDQPEPPPQAERENVDPSAVEPPLRDLKAELDRYDELLTQVNAELRACAQTQDSEAIEECLDSVAGATREYMKDRAKAQASLEELRQRPEVARIGENLQATLRQQGEQIESTDEAVNAFDPQADLQGGCRHLVDRTDELLETNHRLRDTLDETLAEVAGHQPRSDSAPEEGAREDIADRAGLEASLAQWWEADPDRGRKLSTAMIDLDQFGKVNDRYGRGTGNRILRLFAQFLAAESQEEWTIGRFSGQRFVVLLPDTDAETANNAVERIRQGIGRICFEHDEVDIQVTVSCAVTVATSQDTSDTLFARLEATLQEAKRYGRNRTFSHEGEHPSPVIPPSFSLDERRFTL